MNSRLPLLLLLAYVGIISCQKIDCPEMPSCESISLNPEATFITTENQTVLGDVIEIPYSIDNLLKAYESLPPSTKSEINPQDIKPTHYYVRFYPKSLSELDILKNIKPYIFLSETPLDREVKVGGSSYHDPSIPEDLPTYQYTVVPVDRWNSLCESIPVESEILLKAFIPDYDEEYSTKSENDYKIPTEAYSMLLEKAYAMTGNSYSSPKTKGGMWYPSGRIRAYDDALCTMVPVPGVRVRATHLLKVKEVLTNQSGYFVLPSFENNVSYKIVWESDIWDIRDGLTGQATFDGPKTSSSWYPEIAATHEKNVRYAATQRALYRYYYDDIDGIDRPHFSSKLKVCQRTAFSSSPSVFTDDKTMGWHIETWIYNSSGILRNINDMFYYVSHELGHASHYANNNGDYNTYSKSIKESWAVFAGLLVYNKEYGFFHSNCYAMYEYNWPTGGSDRHYSPIFLDLYDDENQSLCYPERGLPNDTVTGYSAQTLNSLLNNRSYTLNDLKVRVKACMPIGVTENQVDSLFLTYENYWAD